MNSEPPPTSLAVPTAPCAAAGDNEQWFKEQVQPHEDSIRGYLRNRFPSVSADDVVQESYLRLLKVRASGSILATRAYLFSVVRNTAVTFFRRGRIFTGATVSELPEALVLAEEPDAASVTSVRERHALVIEAVDRLPSRCRQILALALLQGFTNGEIARKLGLSEATVRVQMARGMKKCVEYLQGKGLADEGR